MPLELYVGIWIVIFITIIGSFAASKPGENEGWLTSLVLIFVVWGVVGIFPIGKNKVVTSPATNTRAGNEIIVQSPISPTRITTDIKFIDQPLKIIKTIATNVWGFEYDSVITYEIQIDTTNPEKQ